MKPTEYFISAGFPALYFADLVRFSEQQGKTLDEYISEIVMDHVDYINNLCEYVDEHERQREIQKETLSRPVENSHSEKGRVFKDTSGLFDERTGRGDSSGTLGTGSGIT